MVTATPISGRPPDVVIYAERAGPAFRVRYELQIMITAPVKKLIDDRLLRSFSLDRSWPDSYTERGIRQKAKLMQNIFRQDFGLNANIIEILI
jgi:hypothetical protein